MIENKPGLLTDQLMFTWLRVNMTPLTLTKELHLVPTVIKLSMKTACGKSLRYGARLPADGPRAHCATCLSLNGGRM